MKLYELAGQLALINDQLEEAGGELSPDLEKTLDAVNMEMQRKVLSISEWILNISANEKAIDAEIQRLQSKKKAAANLTARLKDYIKQNMIIADTPSLKFATISVRVQANPPSVEIKDEEAVPAAYLTVIPESYQVNKKAILEAHKNGVDVSEFAEIRQGNHLRIL